MNNTEATKGTEMQNLTIKGREFTVQGPTPQYGTYMLHGSRGATYIAVPAYIGDANTYKVIGGRYSATELRIDGNAVRLTNISGELREVTR